MQENLDNHKIEIVGKKRISLNQVSDVKAFNDEKIMLLLNDSTLAITGSGLKITQFDKATGSFIADGKIFSVTYDYKKQAILKRIFK